MKKKDLFSLLLKLIVLVAVYFMGSALFLLTSNVWVTSRYENEFKDQVPNSRIVNISLIGHVTVYDTAAWAIQRRIYSGMAQPIVNHFGDTIHLKYNSEYDIQNLNTLKETFRHESNIDRRHSLHRILYDVYICNGIRNQDR